MRRLRYLRKSVRGRVTALTGLLLATALVVAALALAGWTRRSLESDVRAALNDQVRETRLLVEQAELPGVLEAVGERTGQVQVIDSSSSVIAATPGLAQRTRLDVIPAPTGQSTTEVIIDGARIGQRLGNRYLLLARPVVSSDGPVVIYAISSLRPADRAVRSLTLAFLGGIPALLLIAGVLIWRAVGRALRPVAMMRAEVEAIDARSLDQRVTAPNSDDEIDRLAVTMNGLLDRMDIHQERQRRFAADASHELRSPLASARAQLEIALAYPDRTDWVETGRDVLIELARLESLASDLLQVAKLRAGTGGRQDPVAINEILDDEVRAQPAEGAAVDYTPPGAPLIVTGDRELLVRVIRNLFGNAQRHADSRISVDVTSDGETVTVQIANDGAAIPADQHDEIFVPFTRLDDARSSDEGGAGLGLAIARRIAQDHRGTLVSAPVATGALFVLRLPAAPLTTPSAAVDKSSTTPPTERVMFGG